MKASVLESPGDLEILEEMYSTWEIRNYSKLQQRNHSPEFECGGFKWYFQSLTQTKSLGESYSSHGETIKRKIHQHTSKSSLLKTPHKIGMSVHNSR